MSASTSPDSKAMDISSGLPNSSNVSNILMEIDDKINTLEKEIQNKIKETQAKLSGGGGSKPKITKSKLRRLKREEMEAGAEETGSTSFRPSRSNVETISQIVSPKDIFPETDLRLISTVDSADYAKYDITPEQVINYLFKMDKDSSLQKNKFAMGLVLNKLLLAFKNKPKFLENLVMNSEPSLYSILNQIKKEMGERRLPE